MKRLIAFDLDGTLAESKQPIDAEMSALLARLSQVAQVAVISGGDWPQFQSQLLAQLPPTIDLSRWFVLPTSGTKLYRFAGGAWELAYAERLSDAERTRIVEELEAAVSALGFIGDESWGPKIEDRGTQLTFSGLGQDAPLAAKRAWDPDFAKRKLLQQRLGPRLPGFAVRVGGSTSVDITRIGVDKAYGLRKLAEASAVSIADMIFVGDALYEGGNDAPVKTTGVDTVAVRDITETKRVIETICACLDHV